MFEAWDLEQMAAIRKFEQAFVGKHRGMLCLARCLLQHKAQPYLYRKSRQNLLVQGVKFH